jgi:hypothetical protein
MKQLSLSIGLGLKPQNLQSLFLVQASQQASHPATELDISAKEVL